MHDDDEYGPPTELKQLIDKLTKKYQKKLASNGSPGGGGCGCNIKKNNTYLDLDYSHSFTLVTM